MNFLRILFATLAFLVLTPATITLNQSFMKRDSSYAPIAVTRIYGSPWLDIAIPHKYFQRTSIVRYFYEPTEELLAACPAYTKIQLETQAKWREENKLQESKLYFLRKCEGEKTLCERSAAPSIQRAKYENGNVKYCGPLQAGETYEVGYSISTDDHGKDIQFITIYEICYSENLAANKPHQGTLFTTHRIDSPSLMLLKLREFYQGDPMNSFTSFLDRNQQEVNDFYKDYFVYMFVTTYDMPTKVWEYATFFPINYTPIPQQEDLYKGMIKIDNYFRLFSLQNRKILTIYSGTSEMTKNMEMTSDNPSIPPSLTDVTITSFWRIYRDKERNSILIVTQYSEYKLQNCGETYICEDGFEMLNVYKNGGCSYMCSVNSKIIQKLGSTQFKIGGKLDLTIQFTKGIESSKSTSPGIGESNNEGFMTANANIGDFMGNEGLAVALMSFDGALATMLADSAAEGNSGHSNDGNADGHGHSEGVGQATDDGGE